MTGTTNPDKRAQLWEDPDKRLYFMTPGTLKNDIVKGILQYPSYRPAFDSYHHFCTPGRATSNTVALTTAYSSDLNRS